MVDIQTLMENKDFSEKLALTETTEEVIDVFAEYGVTITEDELEAALASVKSNGNELDEAALENVSGGIYGAVITGLIALGDRLGTWKWWRNKLGM